MLKKLRWKFVFSAMMSLGLVLLLLLACINGINYYKNSSEIEQTLSLILEHHGDFEDMIEKEPQQDKPPEHLDPFEQEPVSPEKPYTTRYFTVTWTGDGTDFDVNTERIAAVSDEEALAIAKELCSSGKKEGYYGIYRYQIFSDGDKTGILFLDCEIQQKNTRTLLLVSVSVGFFSMLAVFALVVYFSGIAMRPYVKSMKQQKQFITDAGHELKTPLTIISSNVELLEMDLGENEWLSGIRHQTARLQKLVGEMILLAKHDEERPLEKSEFDLSEAVLDTASAFAAFATSKGKQFSLDIKENIRYCGDEGQIRKLCSILCDNAVKYCDDDGWIEVMLSDGRHPVLTVCNDFVQANEIEADRLFDRFYRADRSRNSQSGSYGLGLSIAQAIVSRHGGSIKAIPLDKKMQFTVILP